MNMVDEADDPTIDKPSKRRSVESPSPGPKRRKVGQYSLSLSVISLGQYSFINHALCLKIFTLIISTPYNGDELPTHLLKIAHMMIYAKLHEKETLESIFNLLCSL